MDSMPNESDISSHDVPEVAVVPETTTDPEADGDSSEDTKTQVKETSRPEYSQVTDTSKKTGETSLNRFLDVEVTVSAELGRVDITIGDLIGLSEGSVVELNRPVSSPVDLMAQGQRVGTGEVVVIDDCFAVRIKSIESIEPHK